MKRFKEVKETVEIRDEKTVQQQQKMEALILRQGLELNACCKIEETSIFLTGDEDFEETEDDLAAVLNDCCEIKED